MKKTSFLVKLHAEGRLQVVEPSDEMKDAYANKSESHLISAKILLENNRLEESVSMVYYSMYHMLLALLYKIGIKCENHTVAISLLKQVFDIDNSAIFLAKKERIDKQYYIDHSTTRRDVEKLIETAEKFNAQIRDFTEKLNAGEILKYQTKIEKLLKQT